MALKLIATKNADGSLKLTLDGDFPKLEPGERLVISLSTDIEDEPWREKADADLAAAQENQAAVAAAREARRAKAGGKKK